MRVSEVMTRGVECIGPDATLQDAAKKMKSLDMEISQPSASDTP